MTHENWPIRIAKNETKHFLILSESRVIPIPNQKLKAAFKRRQKKKGDTYVIIALH